MSGALTGESAGPGGAQDDAIAYRVDGSGSACPLPSASRPVLQDVTFDVARGEIVGIVGDPASARRRCCACSAA